MESIRPSQVRARILQEHATLRVKLDSIALLIEELQAGSAAAFTRALTKAQALYRDLRAHIDFEDELLGPALRDIDSWGPLRADRLASHHREQRQQLRTLAERSNSESPEGLAGLLTSLIQELRTDMLFEERDVLSADLLRDDLISVGEDG